MTLTAKTQAFYDALMARPTDEQIKQTMSIVYRNHGYIAGYRLSDHIMRVFYEGADGTVGTELMPSEDVVAWKGFVLAVAADLGIDDVSQDDLFPARHQAILFHSFAMELIRRWCKPSYT